MDETTANPIDRLTGLVERLVAVAGGLDRRLKNLEAVVPAMQAEIGRLHEALDAHQKIFEQLAGPASKPQQKAAEC